ncbi:MAG: metallophosphoesterase family protein [bacterium]|nr:metallophosphoesterase family protein [bacterium]
MNDNKIAVISDIHSNRWALEAVLEDIANRNIKNTVDLGDSLYGSLDPIGTFNILKKENIPSVCGNQDREIIEPIENNSNSESLQFVKDQLTKEQIDWLESLEPVTAPFDNICTFHGSPQNDMEYLIEEVTETGVIRKSSEKFQNILKNIDRKIILCGHSHVPGSVQLPDGRIIINPGSVGIQAYTDDLPYPHIMETGTPHARYCIIQIENRGVRFEHISVPYDWETASITAEKNGRKDWAFWLKTGRAIE